jgi:hypothetical protein
LAAKQMFSSINRNIRRGEPQRAIGVSSVVWAPTPEAHQGIAC